MLQPALAQSITFLYTRDLAASAQFYENVLGLTLARDQGDCRIYHLAGEAYVGVCQRDSAPEQTQGVCLTLVVEDVDEWHTRLSAQGAAFTQPPTANAPYGIYHCYLRDPNGYLIEIQRFDEPLRAPAEAPLETSEPPTTLNLITFSAAGFVKRTPRHLYERQRRGGLGIFDIEISEEDAPLALMLADVSRALLWLTNYGRAFRVPVSDLPETPVRGKGRALSELIPLMPGERLVTALPERERGNIAVLTHSGYARALPAHIVGPAMRPGTELYKFIDNGHLVSACWTAGDEALFVATRRGLAIRFPEKQLPLAGGQALRLEAGDAPIAMAGVRAEGGVFLLGPMGWGRFA